MDILMLMSFVETMQAATKPTLAELNKGNLEPFYEKTLTSL